MRVLFVVPWPPKSGPFRFRISQYLPYLAEAGIDYTVRPFVSPRYFEFIYKPGLLLPKLGYFLYSMVNRFFDLFRAMSYDVIFIQREACPYGPAVFERLLSWTGRPIVYDFDDAIYTQPANPPNKMFAWLKCPGKTATDVRMASLVLAGNSLLADYAKHYNKNVMILPTPIDTDEITPSEKRNGKVVLGWTGSPSTVEYMHRLDEVLVELSQRFDIQVEVFGGEYSCPGVDVKCTSEWTREGELEALRRFDVGLMPLPDTAWTRGKCGFKVIEYMAAGIASVADAVGANKDIIVDGETGFLAHSTDEWIEALAQLIEDRGRRLAMGLAGRERCEEHYSVKANAPKFVEALKSFHTGGHEIRKSP